MKLITLTTDFGSRDWFVGTMKGVILRLCPQTVIVDLTHEAGAGDLRAGAFALAASCRFFPTGTIHTVVVDPGVGGPRRAIAVHTADYFFVGPDNGVLSFALAGEKIHSIHRLENADCFLRPVSRTFHGRDIFAPVAAHLARGRPIHKLGPRQSDFVRLPWPEPHAREEGIEGEIVYVDRFGNLISNVDAGTWRNADASNLRVELGRRRKLRLATHYQAVPRGKPLALIGSSGFLEIAVNGGSAAKVLGLAVGSPLRICRA